MKKYLSALVWALVFAQPVSAEDLTEKENKDEIETNAFGYPDKSLVKIIEASGWDKTPSIQIHPKPECNNQNLLLQARQALKPYIHSTGQTVSDKRRTKLVLKNVDNFTAIEPESFNPQNARSVAARLVELKINNHLTNQNIKICQSDNPILKSKLYLVMYDTEDKVKVDIINFSDKFVPGFVYAQD